MSARITWSVVVFIDETLLDIRHTVTVVSS